MTENPPWYARNEHRHDEGYDKAEVPIFHAVDEVHAEKAGDERGEHNVTMRIVPYGEHSEACWEQQIPVFMACLGFI